MRKEARHTQMRDRASGVHPDILEHLPPKKTGVCLLYCFVLSSLISLGAGPHHHLALSVKEYGRMIEIYLYTSVAPVTFATVGNREWGQIGSNYFRSLIALAFQAFLMMICVGIYAAMVSSIELSDNMRQALLQIIISTVVLCYSLMRTGTFSRSLFQAH